MFALAGDATLAQHFMPIDATVPECTVEAPNFREVYDAHFELVWRWLGRLGVGESEVADAAQEVFLVVHRRLSEFEGRSKLTTWLFGICMRVAADRRKKVFRHPEHILDLAPSDEADPRSDVIALTEKRERVALLEAILDRLPLEQRTVFSLFELEEMSGQAIAEQMNIPLGTVHSRLRLARETFRLLLDRARARERNDASLEGGV